MTITDKIVPGMVGVDIGCGMDDYRREMEGIYTTCVDRTTLDEAPMAYKGMDEIISHIGPTVDIVERITPVYNFKAAE